ncbi:MAG: hypothetical protein ACLQBK_23595 [Candidatus Sulfotelmatobacter sp.]
MSSAVISTTAATGRPFVFDAETVPEVGPLASSRRASLDRTAPSTSLRAGEGGCSHISQQAAVKNQQSIISTTGNRKSAIGNSLLVTLASRLAVRPAPEMVSSGVPALDALTGGLPRGCLTEICGPASSGRTTLLLAALAAATRRGEFCAVVDASDALDPQSAAAAGVELDRLLWVRCAEDPPRPRTRQNGCPISRAPFAREVGISAQAVCDSDRIGLRENGSRQSEQHLEQVLRATDLLLESGGFGLIALDLGDLPSQAARRIPLTTWFRFRRAVEHTPTILLALEQQAIAGSCSSLLLQLGAPSDQEALRAEPSEQAQCSREAAAWDSPARQCRVGAEKKAESHRDGTAADGVHVTHPSHAHLLTGFDITAELIRSRIERKPARSVTFESKTAWAG